MPNTRRSSTSTGSTITDSVEQTGTGAGARQRSKGTVGNEGHTGNRDGKSSNKIENGSRTRRQAATDRQTKTESSGKNLLQSKEMPLTSGKKQNVEQKGNSRKRPPEKLSESPAKKVMLSSVISSTKMPDIVSPRRSSRASVPNRRYKDMEVLTSAKSNKSETSGKDRNL